MQIGKENIESFIFDYHEGNLSDSEKNEVLNYIHTHPEYEVEFTQWAQSYLPHESTVENYGLTTKLLQTPSTAWYNKSWIKITPLILLIGFSSFLYFTSQNSSSISVKHITTNLKKNVTTETKQNTLSETKSVHINRIQETPTTPAIANPSTYNNIQLTDNTTIDSSAALTHFENSTTSDINTTSSIKENKINHSDSVTTNTNVVQPNQKDDLNKKRKSYKIKPATDFIPTNPNF